MCIMCVYVERCADGRVLFICFPAQDRREPLAARLWPTFLPMVCRLDTFLYNARKSKGSVQSELGSTTVPLLHRAVVGRLPTFGLK